MVFPIIVSVDPLRRKTEIVPNETLIKEYKLSQWVTTDFYV